MTSAQRMPVTPDPESDEVLFRMLKLIIRHPSCLHEYVFEFKTSPKGTMYFADSKWKESIKRFHFGYQVLILKQTLLE